MVEPIGHDAILRAFDRMITGNRLGHAYLFVGPTGVGKTTVMDWIAHRLWCVDLIMQPDGYRVPCGVCATCRAISQGTHPDIRRVVGDADGVDAIREWRTALQRTSLFSGWKIGMVESVDALSESAGNAMLKMLEEPQERTLLLLTARHARAPLATIASRCALVQCHRMPAAVLERVMRERVDDPEVAANYAQEAEGCLGRAVRRCLPEERAREAQEDVAMLFQGSMVDRLHAIERVLHAAPEHREAVRAEYVQIIDRCRQYARILVRREAGHPHRVAALLPWLRVLAQGERYVAAHCPPRTFLETLSACYP
ncbi:hypothetical protein HYV74_04690 [Candidatus Uhrbacteria bacterium]|nr:hypothetical protein [Candidatus Uhrbacteria bacterium]